MGKAGDALKRDYLKNLDRISDHERDITDLRRDARRKVSWVKDIEAENKAIKEAIILLEGIFDTDVVDTVEIVYRNRYDCLIGQLAAA